MSIGPAGGIIGSAAGTSLAQSKGSDTERAQRDAASQQRHISSEKKAESASGIGKADGDEHETADRDADGRRLWEEIPTDAVAEESSDEPQNQSKDTSGQRGNLLDLSG